MKTIKTLMMLLMISSPFFLSVCNTTKGVGQDLKAAGSAIEDEAKDKGADDR